MSRIGRKPVNVPEKVSIASTKGEVRVEGPLGSLVATLPPGVSIDVAGAVVNVLPPRATRANRGFQGLARALIANMVQGVVKGYDKTLEINGVGYKAELSGSKLTLSLGYSHTIVVPLPKGIKAEVNKQQNVVKISGIDKQLVGQTAARIRSLKVPEPYKAKGVKYAGEVLRRKAGKTGAS